MSFADYLDNLSGKQTVWLYEITRDGVLNRYHRGRGDYTYNSETYFSETILHTSITDSADLQRSGTSVVLPASNAVAQGFIGSSRVGTTIDILRGFLEDGAQEFVYEFRGTVASAKSSWPAIELICKDELYELSRGFAGPVFQRPCWKTVYNGPCRLNADDFYAAYTATALTGAALTVTGADGQANGFFTGGLVRYPVTSGTEQWVTGHAGTALTMVDLFPALDTEIIASGSAAIELAPGCPKVMSVCDVRFSNSLNFGGLDKIENTYDGRRIAL